MFQEINHGITKKNRISINIKNGNHIFFFTLREAMDEEWGMDEERGMLMNAPEKRSRNQFAVNKREKNL